MAAMKLLSVSVGLAREIEWHGKLVRTSIFKSPASGTFVNASGTRIVDHRSHLEKVTKGTCRRVVVFSEGMSLRE